jgi:kynurenine formamidase
MQFPASGRIIDLSAEVRPGVLKVNGEYLWSEEVRRCELRQFVTATDHTLMHWLDTETHIGTHVEVPAHLHEGGKTCAEMPLETFLGEAIVLRFEHGHRIAPPDLAAVRPGDIVLLWSPAGGPSPVITPEGAKHLAALPIKMLGVQNVSPDDPGAYAVGSKVAAETHEALLRRDIPIIEGLVNLEAVPQERVSFIGLPLRVRHMDSSWIRAIAICP